MRILHICWDISSYVGGGERAVLSIVRAIRCVSQCELAVVSRDVTESTLGMVAGVPVTFIPASLGPFDNPLPRVKELRQVVSGADIIHVHQAHTVLLDMVQVFKRHWQRLVVSDYGGGGPNVTRLLGRHTRVDAAIAYSDVLKLFAAKSCRHVEEIPLPIDSELFRIVPDSVVDRRSVLCVGRLLPHKGFDQVVRALPPGFSLTIVGKPYDLEYARYLSRLARVREVRFLSDVEDLELVREMNRAAVVVAPSVFTDYKGQIHRKTELFGLVPVEAASCGRPVVVSSAVPALGRAIDDGLIIGARYCWNNTDELARSIVDMATTDVLVSNRQYVEENFAPRAIGRQLLGLYDRLLESPVGW